MTAQTANPNAPTSLSKRVLPARTDKDLWVGWEEYHYQVEQLCQTVHESGYQFDVVLCLARGGLRVGDVVSRVFERPLAILSTSAYREAAGTEQGELTIASNITMVNGVMAGNILLVDDLVDSGVTLVEVLGHLKRAFPAIKDIRTAVLWYKACSVIKPDYFIEYLPTNPWIHQPFEDYDTLRPHQLAARLAAAE